MAQMIKGNYNALMWLQDELQQSLSHALTAMNSYIEDDEADKNLSNCVESIYQINGTLEMVNISGAAMLTNEMQSTAVALRSGATADKAKAEDALVRSLLLLPNYLKLLSDTFQDHPISLLDSINELREAQGKDTVTEKSLFNPALTVTLPDSIAPNPHRKLPEINIERTKLGHAFQVILLNWLRQQDSDNLRKMRGMVHYLRLACLEEKTTLFWWIAESLLETIEDEGINASPEVKKLLGKLVVPIKTQSEQSEAELLSTLPTALIDDLLLEIASASSHGPQVTLLKMTFDLYFFDHKPKIYGMSDNALGDAHIALLEQLEDLKALINDYDRDQDLNADVITSVIQQLQSMTDTLAMLTEYEASNLMHHQVEKLEALVEDGSRPDDETLTELADVLLKVEMFLQSSTQANAQDQVRQTVITECLLEMANIKEALTLMSQSGRYPDGLGDSEDQLNLIAGSLEMLNYPEAAEIIQQTAEKMSAQTQSNEAFSPAKLNRLADILSCCDLYMEGIKQHGHAEADYLNEASSKLSSYEFADEEAETMIDVAEATTEIAEPPLDEPEQDEALAELDSLLASDEYLLLLEDTADTEQALEVEVEQPTMEVEPSTPPAEATAIDIPQPQKVEMPAEVDWQFADGIDDEIAAIFIEEANEVLADLDKLTPEWLSTNDQNALSDIRRHFHTLKGSGRMAGATVIGELAWAVEQVLNHVLDGTRPDSPQVRTLVSSAKQHVPDLLARFTQAQNDTTDTVDALLELQQQCLATEADASEHVVEEAALETENEIELDSAADNEAMKFDLDAYTDSTGDDLVVDDESTSVPDFAIDTEVLTSVEQYIRRQAENELINSPSVVEEDELSANNTTLEVDEDAFAVVDESNDSMADLEAIDTEQEESDLAQQPLTSVEAYIQQLDNESSVARYTRTEQQSSPAIEDNPLEPVTIERPASFTSVDRYLANKAKHELPQTSVELYILAQEASDVQLAEQADEALSEQDELLQIFIGEAEQHIATLEQGLEDIAFSRQVNKPLLRAVHSLKGCANVAGIKPMALVATELDHAMKQLHAQDIVLDADQMLNLETAVKGLAQILASITQTASDPDLAALSNTVQQLIADNEVTSETPVIDPEFLVGLLEETDELLEAYTQQLSEWQISPDDQENLHALQTTLNKLEQTATDAEQKVIADVYAGLKQLILNCQPRDTGLNNLLEQGYEQLNEHIESLLQNKPLSAEKDFPAQVAEFLISRDEQENNQRIEQVLDETDFALPSDLDPELLEAFTEEAEELLTSSGQVIKSWQDDLHNEQDALQLQRDLHTLKGGARLAGITPMADLTHQTETLVLAVSDDKRVADEDFFDLLQRCQDKLTEMQEQLKARSPITTAVSLMAEITMLIGGEEIEVDDRPLPQPEIATTTAPEPEPLPVAAEAPVSSKPAHVEQVRVRADLLDYLSNFAGEVSISRDRVTQQHTAMRHQLHEMEETVTRLHDQLRKLEIETETQILFRYEDEKLKQDSDFDPLELDRFSMIQQLSRGLTESVIDLNDISHSMDTLVKETETILLQQSRLSADLQEGLMNTRLLPFNGVVPRLERIVRQTAAELNKKSDFTVFGAELEMDRTVLDRLVAPIEHILRNAIAHGLEDPEARAAAGKSESGQLALHIEREGSEMVLTLSDDGKGIDVDKIRDKALSLNLIDADNIPSEEDLIQLILTSGFSTAESISQVAGRGVGMDVVNNEIRSLKGRLNIQSVAGQGTTFVIRLPLSLSLIQALLVRIQDEQYAIPLGSINAGERISVRDIKYLIGTSKPQYQFNDKNYDFVPLSSLLGKPLALPDNLKQQLPLLLFHSGDMRIALLVDDIVSNREIVIKSVGQQLSHITAINGATILGDGRVVFILDIPTLIESNRNLELDTNAADNLEKELEQLQDRTPIAMVVDDSITMRKASGNLLKRLGFEVMTARDGVDALAQLHEHKPDIILLDVEMPRMDGFEFASIVRNDINFRHLPIIMITSRTGSKHRERAMGIGVNAYLGKPYQEDELVENMQKLLGSDLFQQLS
jgi:chemosensory pili system protein ChpA (sensor histidine kinase/response regulator)